MHISQFSKIAGVVIVAMAGVLVAQTGLSTVEGTVTDPSGAIVPNAQVEVSGSGAARSANTDNAGRYKLAGLQPGTYRVIVSSPGFLVHETQLPLSPGVRTAHNPTLIIAATAETVTVADTSRQLDMDSSSNAGALVIKGSDLGGLSDDPDDLSQDLQALAGPSAGPNGAEFYVDGFSGGKLPPKSSIREIRVNQNPFSAEYDRLGHGRVEVFTKPGTDRYRGEVFFNFGDSMFNARNPFALEKPDYQRRMLEGNVAGPLGKRASFFVQLERRDIQETSIINALVLDSSLAVVPFRQTLLAPISNNEANVRLDYQLSSNNTLIGRYDWETRNQRNSGLDTFSLPSRALNRDTRDDVVQITDTAVLSASTIHEIRAQYSRTGSMSRAASSDPAVQVLEAFSDGGAAIGFADLTDRRWELTDLVSLSRNRHVIKLGARVRQVSLRDQSNQDFNGSFTFTSLDAYRATLAGLQQGLTPQQIRAQGGGASQFSITAGQPMVDVKQFDAGVFVQDDWRVHPQFTITAGLRYEVQTNIGDRRGFAPRVGIAWAPSVGGRKQPVAIIRAGFGVFYDRVDESLTLDSRRLDGQHQIQYIVPNPDFYPSIPTPSVLAGNAQEQGIRLLDRRVRAPYIMQTALSVERQFPKGITTSVTYMNSRGVHTLRSRNINAPLPGTYDPAVPTGGVRPYPGGNLYLYESSGSFRQHQVVANVNARVTRRISAFGYYAWGKADSDTDGSSTFPANQYDLTSEYGRAGFDVRHRAYIGGAIEGPYGFTLSPFVTANTGRPFNITTGKDLNGDSIFNDRPAAATNPAAPGVVSTAYGLFDSNPATGQKTIARNLGNSPGMFAVNVRLAKTFAFAREDAASGSDGHGPAGPSNTGAFAGIGHGSGGGHGPGGHGPGHDGGGSGDGRFRLTFSVFARNLLNTVNPAAPVGNLTSPLFGQSLALAGFGHRGGGTSANRSIELQVRFAF